MPATRIEIAAESGVTRSTITWPRTKQPHGSGQNRTTQAHLTNSTGIHLENLPPEGELMRWLSVILSGLFLCLSPAWSDEGHHHALTEEEVGSVHFTTSCSKTVEVNFNRAVALLHSFQ